MSEEAGDVQTDVSWTGRIAGIFVAPAGGAPTRPVERVRAVPGRGLEGDRNFAAPPAPTHKNPDEELTLFSLEALAEANREYGLSLAPGDTRRNVATEGVPINDLVGREFTLGDVRVRGLELCEPCLHLAELTGERDILRALVHRGGLRAQILSEGTLTVGDPISLAADQAT